MLFQLSVFILAAAQLANASLSPTFPVAKSTCEAGKGCEIKWIDTSSPPSASSMGETAVDLVTGDPKNLQIAQELGSVAQPGSTLAKTFIPEMTLSPTTQYAIRFRSKKDPSNPIFSTFFTITGGSGTAKTIPAAVVDTGKPSISTPDSIKNSTVTGTTPPSAAPDPVFGADAASSTAGETTDQTTSSSACFTYSSSAVLLALSVVTLAL